MKTNTRLLAAAVFALALPMTASAQTPTPAAPAAPASAVKLEVGKWTGTVAPPSMDALELEFAVKMDGDTMKIDLTIVAMGMTMPLTGIKMEGPKLEFGFLAGDSDVKCTLTKKDDGSYAGPCADAGGQGGPMTMIPPKKGTFSF